MRRKQDFLKVFAQRKSNIARRVQRDYIKNGVATIPCRITDFFDVVNRYSTQGCESLNPEFADYVKDSVEVIPPEYPIVLEIVAKGLSENEKKVIENTICESYTYDLGLVEKEGKRQMRVFFFYCIGLAIAGVILWLTDFLHIVQHEILFVFFWFFGDRLFDFIFFTRHDIRVNKQLAGRLDSIKVVFTERLEEPHYTEGDVKKMYEEIAEDVDII